MGISKQLYIYISSSNIVIASEAWQSLLNADESSAGDYFVPRNDGAISSSLIHSG